MPKGTPIVWTREMLEEVLTLEGSDAHAEFAARHGIVPNTAYSMRQRVRESSIEAVLTAQEHRKERVVSRETELAALSRTYVLTARRSGRGGSDPQYTITMPPLAAEAWLAKWGGAVRWEFTEDGARLIPIPESSPDQLPAWLKDNES